ncbi:MAG: CdaR family protein [Bacillota bacterium]|jgi:YbbR domain-containing protein|nr:CdaR family protein [Bacillota bacterium]MDP4155463.1 CdaR family protein [Bacillota bacterium]
MDKLMDNPWFIKVIALLLALLLYSSVPAQSGSKLSVDVPGDQTEATITDIPVKAYYDTSNLVVSGLPSNVSVTVDGPLSLVQSAKALRNFEVYVDLTKAKIGNQTVKLKVRNMSDKLKVSVKPSYVNVSVQEKVTKMFKVTAEYNKGNIADGYTAGTPTVEPNKVTISGAKDVIDRITYVKATLALGQSANATVTDDAPVRVLDKDLNKLDVVVEPQTVKVTLPIKNTSKTVPIDIVQKGTPPNGVTISSIDLDTPQATITGDEAVLKSTDHVRVEVDVSQITDNTTLTLPVIIPNGITKVTPELVKATVKIGANGSKKLSGIPIGTRGLASQYKAVFMNPVGQTVSLSVNGPSDKVNAAALGDFSAYVDLTNLTEGDHDVQIQVDGPSGLSWNLDNSTAKITISKAV